VWAAVPYRHRRGTPERNVALLGPRKIARAVRTTPAELLSEDDDSAV
jgi:hypothetical protein